MAQKTNYFEMEAALGQPIAELVAKRRGERVSWRRIALELTARTGMDVTGETVRVWSLGRTPMTDRPPMASVASSAA